MYEDDNNKENNMPHAPEGEGKSATTGNEYSEPTAPITNEGAASEGHADAFGAAHGQPQGGPQTGQPQTGQADFSYTFHNYSQNGNNTQSGQAPPGVPYGSPYDVNAGGYQPGPNGGYTQNPYGANNGQYQNPYGGGYNNTQPYGMPYPYYIPTPQPRKKMRKGAVIGIIAGSVALVMLIFFFVTAIVYPIIEDRLKDDGYIPSDPTPSYSYTPDETDPDIELYPPNADITSIGGQMPQITNEINPVPEIATALEKSVVGVITSAKIDGKVQPYGRGTGFVIHEDGYIMTNYHVIAGGVEFAITIADEETEYPAQLVGGDATMDIAVLKVDASALGLNLVAAALGDSDQTKVGEIAVAVGNPSGAGANLTGTVTVGYISALKRPLMFNGSEQLFTQTDAAVNPGNSGGPLVNSKGEVIGVVTLKSLVSSVDETGSPINAEGIGFAIPINSAAKTALQIIGSGSVKRPGIGIEFRTIDAVTAQEEDLVEGKQIASFMQNSTAKEAGLAVDDIITHINGISVVEQSNALADAIASSNIGDSIVLTVWRDGEVNDCTVTIGDINTMQRTEE